jgi:PAS domain S-box-containing protein
MDLYRHQVREISEYAMFTLDPQAILQSWNAGVERLLGYSEQEWVGQPASIIFTPAEKAMEVCESEMRKAQDSGSSATDIRWHATKMAPSSSPTAS